MSLGSMVVSSSTAPSFPVRIISFKVHFRNEMVQNRRLKDAIKNECSLSKLREDGFEVLSARGACDPNAASWKDAIHLGNPHQKKSS